MVVFVFSNDHLDDMMFCDCILVLVFSNDHLDDMVNQEIKWLYLGVGFQQWPPGWHGEPGDWVTVSWCWFSAMTTWMTWWTRRLSGWRTSSRTDLPTWPLAQPPWRKNSMMPRWDALALCMHLLLLLLIAFIYRYSLLSSRFTVLTCDSDEWLAFYSMFLNIHQSSSHTLWINRSTKTVETVLRIVWGGEVGQLGEHWAGILLMQVQFPVVGR